MCIRLRLPPTDTLMTDRRAQPGRSRPRHAAVEARDASQSTQDVADVVARFAPIGRQCAFANARLIGRVVTAFYDEALKAVDLRASQLALMWAIVACEPVEISRLGDVTATDQTTLSRTVDKLRRSGLVEVETGQDRRVRFLRLSTQGRRVFARAMPHWQRAQRGIDRWLSLATLEELERQARRLARGRPSRGGRPSRVSRESA
jgi:DNA-binding MarR family transcriptional regulator